MMEVPGFSSADINVLNIDVRNFPSNFNLELEESVDLMQRVDGSPEEETVDVETIGDELGADPQQDRSVETRLDVGNYTIEHVPPSQSNTPPIQLLETAQTVNEDSNEADKLVIGIEASDVTSLLEQFEESEASLLDSQPENPTNKFPKQKAQPKPRKSLADLDPVEIAKKINPAKRKSAILIDVDVLPFKRSRLKHSSVHRVQEKATNPVRSLPGSRCASPATTAGDAHSQVEYLSLEHDYCVNWDNSNLLKSSLSQQLAQNVKLTTEQRREVYRKKYKVRKKTGSKTGSNCSTPQSLSPLSSAPASPSCAKEPIDEAKKEAAQTQSSKEPLFDKIPDYFAGKLLMGMYKERDTIQEKEPENDQSRTEEKTEEKISTKTSLWKTSKAKSDKKSRTRYRRRSSRSPSYHSSDHSSRSCSRSRSRSRSRSYSSSRSRSRSVDSRGDDDRTSRSRSSSACSRGCSHSPSSRRRLRSRSRSRSRGHSQDRSHSRSRSRSPPVSRSRSQRRGSSRRSRHRSGSSRSASRSRSRSRSRIRSSSRSARRRSLDRRKRDQSLERRQRQKEEEKNQDWENRRVVYVGDIPLDTTKEELYKRFSRFGEIKKITLHFRDEQTQGDHYAFVTFEYTCDAYACIKAGNPPDGIQYDLCFGGRRNFCKTVYEDLDSMNREEVKHEFGYKAAECPEEEGGINDDNNDFDNLLKQAMKKLKR
ncbi:uncharacterized protein [Apostichopus japonicus]